MENKGTLEITPLTQIYQFLRNLILSGSIYRSSKANIPLMV